VLVLTAVKETKTNKGTTRGRKKAPTHPPIECDIEPIVIDGELDVVVNIDLTSLR